MQKVALILYITKMPNSPRYTRGERARENRSIVLFLSENDILDLFINKIQSREMYSGLKDIDNNPS